MGKPNDEGGGLRKSRMFSRKLGVFGAAAALVVAVAAPSAWAAANPPAPPGENPDGRRYELVSPQQKGGSDVLGYSQTDFSLAAKDGDGVLYSSLAAFAGASGAAFPSMYRAVRTSERWETVPASPPQDAAASLAGGGGTSSIVAMSEDLTRSIVMTNRQIVPDAPQGVYSLYSWDYLSGELDLATTKGPVASLFAPLPEFRWATPDGKTVLFATTEPLTDDAPENGELKLYVSKSGVLELVSILPGEIPSSGDGGSNGRPGLYGGKNGSKNAISADGRYVFFSLPVSGAFKDGLFVRDLVEQETTEIEPPGTTVGFGAATPDGRYVLYEVGLTGRRIFLYDVVTGDHVEVSEDSEPADGVDPAVESLLAVSNDLTSVYFLARNQLVDGQPPVPDIAIYSWQPDTGVIHVANVDEPGPEDLLTQIGGGLWQLPTRSDIAETPDGSRMVFSTDGKVAGFDGGGFTQVYLFDRPTQTLTCISCPEGGGTGHAELRSRYRLGGASTIFQNDVGKRRNITTDGRTVFFQTSQRLVPEDTNGRIDVYQWKDGSLSLISGGRGQYDGMFIAASEDGKDVFFATRERLVGHDTDNLADLYDARIGGGYPEPPVAQPECTGDVCQGALTPPPGAPTVGSETLGGSGNVPTPGRVKPSISVARPKATSGPVVKLRVRVSEAGRIVARGALIRRSARSVKKAGVYLLRVALKPRARHALRKRKSLSVRARVVVRATDGNAASKSIKLSFKRLAARKAHTRKGGR